MSRRSTRRGANHSIFPRLNHDHRMCTSNAMRQAEEICEARDVRLTEIRRKVLGAIWSSHRPISAYDLLRRLARNSEVRAPTTVYRALEFLIAQGLVHRLASRNAFIGCIHPNAQHAAYFMICDECGTVTEFEQEPADKLLVKAAHDQSFVVKSKVIELSGTCQHCARA